MSYTPADGVLGRQSWLATPVLGQSVIFDGVELDPQVARSFFQPGQPTVLPLMSGGSLVQRFVGHPHQVEGVAGVTGILTAFDRTIVDWFLQQRLLDRSFDAWLELPIEERWRLRPGDERTKFVLSRRTAGALVDSTVATGDYAPSARIDAFPVPDDAPTALTVVESGSPGAGEVLIDPAVSSQVVESGDLSASFDGAHALVVKHWPLRHAVLRSRIVEHTPEGGVVMVLDFVESVPAADFDLLEA